MVGVRVLVVLPWPEQAVRAVRARAPARVVAVNAVKNLFFVMVFISLNGFSFLLILEEGPFLIPFTLRVRKGFGKTGAGKKFF